jgi:transcriptional regulator
MYLPKLFVEDDAQRIHAFVRAHAFGMLVVAGSDGDVELAHLPFVLDPGASAHGTLRVHVARANPIWKKAIASKSVTAVFTGPHGYVSPTWYGAPELQVPTWNYAVVHAHGHAEGPASRAELEALLVDLSDANEGDSPGRWRYAALDAALREELLAQIVGLSIAVTRWEGKFKLSQNRSPEDQARVAAKLEERGGPDDLEMVSLMPRVR